jgi:AcrR family transcriptional regulator
MSSRTGRRPGTSGASQQILTAARTAFAAHGYEGAGLRAIARDAGVDPALIHHYYGSKQGLFGAATELPFAVGDEIVERLAANRDQVGEGMVRLFLSTWDDLQRRPILLALLRSAATDEIAAAMLRERFGEMILPVVERSGLDHAELRTALCGSQMLGLGLARYVLALGPLAEADADTVALAVGPTIQRYLTDPAVIKA